MNAVKVAIREADVTVAPVDRKHGRGHSMQTVLLSDVTFLPQTIRGELIEEFDFQRRPDKAILKRMQRVIIDAAGKFVIRDGSDENGNSKFVSAVGMEFRAAYIVHRTIYVSKV